VRRKLEWQVATITAIRDETAHAKTLVLDVPDWLGHQAGQHVDVRLTAEDGYQAQRSYSIASSPENKSLELTIERIDDGEVSPYLTDGVMTGDQFELRGPIGGYFVWDGSKPEPVVLIGGGSGLVPLMAMLRHRQAIGSKDDARLLLSSRTLDDVLYRSELDGLRDSVEVKITLTRSQPPPGWDGFTGRIDHDMLVALGPEPALRPDIYVCGPTPFVEQAARLLVEIGHEPAKVYTERFGPTGG
jgi:ferredoxin-NADP reductase